MCWRWSRLDYWCLNDCSSDEVVLDSKASGNYIVTMRARIIKIGNSQGIRIPKVILEQTMLNDEVELRVQDHEIVISKSQKPRASWEESFRVMSKSGDDELVDGEMFSP